MKLWRRIYSSLEWGVLQCCKCGSLVLTGLSSSELVNIKWQYTRLQLLNLHWECSRCCSAVVSDVVGSKDRFSLMDTWYIHGALLRGVGILVWVLFWKCHLMWSKSDQIVFLLAGSRIDVLSCHRRKQCIFILWHHWGCEVWDLLSKIEVLWLWYSISNTC